MDAEPQDQDDPLDRRETEVAWREAIRIAAVAGAAISRSLRLWEPSAAVSVIGVAGLLIGGWPMLAVAARNLRLGRMTMALALVIAITATAASSRITTALSILLLLMVADVLERIILSRGHHVLRDLREALPDPVSVRRPGGIQAVAADKLQAGDIIVVAAGARIPADGVIRSGHSFVDEMLITGETASVEKSPGAFVFAGTMNQSGPIEIRAERLGAETAYGRIVDAVARAERSPAPVQRMTDRLGGIVAWVALAAAAVTLLAGGSIASAISVVLVAGACGVMAGTKLAVLGGMGRAAKSGAIIRTGRVLEILGKVDTIALDKSGALTFGKPEVLAVVPAPGQSEDSVMEAAATAEIRSEHAVGRAIVAHQRSRGHWVSEPERFDYTPGRGIRATIHGDPVLVGNHVLMQDNKIAIPPDLAQGTGQGSVIYVARSGVMLGAITVADTIRPEAARAVHEIAIMGTGLVLLTGDSKAVGAMMGECLGIPGVEAELPPEARLARIRSMVAAGRVVAMVGDGRTDAAALARASVGIAMGSGAEIGRSAADIVLLGNNLLKLTETLRIARWTNHIIFQNFVGTLVIDAIGVGCAMAGLLDPLAAAFIHVGSEAVFVLNATRLLPRGWASRVRRSDNGARAVEAPAPERSHLPAA
jgi:Cd2+/Zn2+-exporting ATPase/Cu+-exporting ATPase